MKDLRTKDQQLRESNESLDKSLDDSLEDFHARNQVLLETIERLKIDAKRAQDGQATMTAALHLVLNSNSAFNTPSPHLPIPSTPKSRTSSFRIKHERTAEDHEDGPARVPKRARQAEAIDLGE
jgi:hypothetical protein